MGKLETTLDWVEENPGLTFLFMIFTIIILGMILH